MPIYKRDYINNSILKELNEKYPKKESEKGVRYKQKLEYLTFEIEFITEPILKTMTNQYGFSVIAIIFYLRTEMCRNGWKVRMDKNIYYDALIDNCSHACNLNPKLTMEILQKLIENRMMYVVQDETIEEGVWLTCTQQVYNYEMACNNRQGARQRQAKKRLNDKDINEGTIEKTEINNQPFGNPIDENPFGL